MRQLFWMALLLVAWGCSQAIDPAADKKARQKSPYFDMVGFMGQLERNSKGMALRKRALMGDKYEEQTLEHPELRRELGIFFAADLRKPAWQGVYDTERHGANTTYTARNDKPELRLLVVGADSVGRVARLDLHMLQDNYLYSSEASGSLYVRYEGGKPKLDSVALSGTQRIVFGSPFNYTLQGKFL